MSYPNNNCGECSIWFAIGEDITKAEALNRYCNHCPANYQIKEEPMKHKYLRHIPSGACYPLESDGKTIIIRDVCLTPEVDGKIFWEYVDEYTEKIAKPSNPYANHK